MKKWFNFFVFSFFSHKSAKEGARRGFGSLFLSFVLTLIFLWSAFVGGDMLPFGARYKSSPDFTATVYEALANADKRVELKIEGGDLKGKKQNGDYVEELLLSTLESDDDREKYSANGFNVVIDMRPADRLAEVYAYAVSNDGKATEISYQDYLDLSEVARLNFDFKLRYTGRELLLTDDLVQGYIEYLDGSEDEIKGNAEALTKELSEGRITKSEYNRAAYELYFTSYYPEITEYEASSKIPLLRNYYYHQYISQGIDNYLFIFDDYLTGSFETKGGRTVSFHGFYSGLQDGEIVPTGATETDAKTAVDGFIKRAFRSSGALTLYAYTVNTFSLAPLMALMIMAATLLTYSIMRLRGVESITSLGGMAKIVGSFSWFSGLSSAAVSVIASFFVGRNMIVTLPLVLFFTALAIRSVIFAMKEKDLYTEMSEQRQTRQTED